MTDDRLTQELRTLLEPLGVSVEPSETPKHPLWQAGTGARGRAWLYRLPDILALAVTQTPKGNSCVLCWPKRRSSALSREQVQALLALLRRVGACLPENRSVETEVERTIEEEVAWIMREPDERLRLEPLWERPEEIALLVAASPAMRLTRDEIEALEIAAEQRLHTLECDEAICFYAVEHPVPDAEAVRHLMLPEKRSVCHPALCGACAPHNSKPWSGYWFLFPIPTNQELEHDAANGVHICPDCLAQWWARQQQREGQR